MYNVLQCITMYTFVLIIQSLTSPISKVGNFINHGVKEAGEHGVLRFGRMKALAANEDSPG